MLQFITSNDEHPTILNEDKLRGKQFIDLSSVHPFNTSSFREPGSKSGNVVIGSLIDKVSPLVLITLSILMQPHDDFL